MDILTFTNGFKDSWHGIEYAAHLAQGLNASIKLVGIVEQADSAQIDMKHPLEDVFSRAQNYFDERGIKHVYEIDNGPAEDVIVKNANSGDYFVILTPLGRPPLLRFMVGSSFRHIMSKLSAPMLYAPMVKLPMKKVLICIGGLGYELAVENLGLQTAKINKADVVLLNVIPPIDIDYPTARALKANMEHIEETDTPIGKSLRLGLANAKSLGLNVSIKLRNGSIVDEILAEIKEGNYDLVCMGTLNSANSLRQMYSANVTADIAEAGLCPILTAQA